MRSILLAKACNGEDEGVQQVADGERVLDMFAGIGPFSITIARYRRCSVTAVDINSDAIGLMRRNIEANRLLGRVEPCWEMQGKLWRGGAGHSTLSL